MSWARAPFPEVVQLTNTSMTLTIELEEVHVNISSVFIQVHFGHLINYSRLHKYQVKLCLVWAYSLVDS